MSHEEDVRDAELLARGEFVRLLAKYEPVIVAGAWPRCAARRTRRTWPWPMRFSDLHPAGLKRAASGTPATGDYETA